MSTQDHWLTKREAADYLRVTPSTINRYMTAGLIYEKIGGKRNSRVRFKKQDLDQFVEMNTWSA